MKYFYVRTKTHNVRVKQNLNNYLNSFDSIGDYYHEITFSKAWQIHALTGLIIRDGVLFTEE